MSEPVRCLVAVVLGSRALIYVAVSASPSCVFVHVIACRVRQLGHSDSRRSLFDAVVNQSLFRCDLAFQFCNLGSLLVLFEILLCDVDCCGAGLLALFGVCMRIKLVEEG